MGETADRVVVELLADIDKGEASIRQYRQTFDTSMKSIEVSAARGEKAIVTSTARSANAMRNLGRQISDIGTGLATGQNVFYILAQQSGQVADALVDTGGKAARVAAFFAGPWGAAALAAGSILATSLIPYIFQTGEEAEKAKGKVDGLKATLEALGQVKISPLQANLDKLRDLEIERRRLEGGRLPEGAPSGRAGALARNTRLVQIRNEIEEIQDRIDANDALQKAQARIDTTYSKTGSGKTKPAKIKEDADLAIVSVGTLAQALGNLDMKALLQANQVGNYSDITGAPDPMAALRKMIDDGYTDNSGKKHVGENEKNQLYDANRAVSNDFYERMDERVRTIADLYEGAMTGANGSIGATLKSILIRAIAQSLAQASVGSSGGGGFFGSLVSGLGSALGFGGARAAGGPVSAGKTYLVGERGPELFHAQRPGFITPNNARVAARSGGATIVNQFTLDMRGALTTPELIANINQAIRQSEARAVQTSLHLGEKGMPGRIARQQVLGT